MHVLVPFLLVLYLNTELKSHFGPTLSCRSLCSRAMERWCFWELSSMMWVEMGGREIRWPSWDHCLRTPLLLEEKKESWHCIIPLLLIGLTLLMVTHTPNNTYSVHYYHHRSSISISVCQTNDDRDILWTLSLTHLSAHVPSSHYQELWILQSTGSCGRS